MNIVLLTGKLTYDPEINYTTGGKAIANFCIETERPIREGQENKMSYKELILNGKEKTRAGNKGYGEGIFGDFQAIVLQPKHMGSMGGPYVSNGLFFKQCSRPSTRTL
ncbi:single-stranded DNA-binding protein [Hominibacterium faecale]|uniref:single-stranded DNA-binding protein n=1 Tax=Hominibacterium faecale TaxID=2839743 RepID=UPI0039EC006A